ncbi:hypothetical protein EVAR_72053_1 [Eumeta japonica]|uniref:DUF5641 domain-containing protein n=1 Tax=Eumeta variegata TaxID=151549 RepID=A0A4C1TDM5_EUMVA|nr:hypothetical protein EVAR_72053_1 [Eumeta japonica]
MCVSFIKLELCAAHLLAKLWNRIEKLISFEIESITFWTDSEISLHWIKTHPSSLTTFVANRVAEIQEWSDRAVWRHVPTRDNSADIVSRGSLPVEVYPARYIAPTQQTLGNSRFYKGTGEIIRESEGRSGIVRRIMHKDPSVPLPPRAAHFGGLWEAVKSKQAKHHIYRRCGQYTTNPEKCDNKLRCLKHGECYAISSRDFGESGPKITSWDCRTKVSGSKQEPNLQCCQIVVVHEDNLPPQEWLTGKVIHVYTGKDSNVRYEVRQNRRL